MTNCERLLTFMRNKLQVEKENIAEEVRHHIKYEGFKDTDFIGEYVSNEMAWYFHGIAVAVASGLITQKESFELLKEFHVCCNELNKYAYQVYHDERCKNRRAHSRRYASSIEGYNHKVKPIDLDIH